MTSKVKRPGSIHISEYFYFIFLTLLQLVQLLTTFEHHCCCRTKVKMEGKRKKLPPSPYVFDAQKSQCQIGLSCGWD